MGCASDSCFCISIFKHLYTDSFTRLVFFLSFLGSGHSCTHFLNISRAMVTLGLAGSLEVMRMRTWKRFFDVLQSRFSNPDKRLPGSAIGPDQRTRTCRIDDNDLLLPFSPSPPVH